MAYFYLLLGVVLLLLGGDWLVKGAVDIAYRFKISTLVVGMTVVSFATSAPELLVSVDAALNGLSDISFGNVIGSNIANIALILGLTAIVFPIKVQPKTYKVDFWLMMAVTLLLYLFVKNDLVLRLWESIILVVALIAYNILMIVSSRKAQKKEDAATLEEVKEVKRPAVMLFFLAIGVVSLKFGSEFLIDGAVELADAWGVSERVIGITIVSLGTSLPELAASMVAAFKGEQELSIGNLIGSNIFNILAVLGITGLLVELPVNSPELVSFDFPYLFGVCLLLYPFMRFITKGSISRAEGLVMVLAYSFYIFWVF